MPFLSIIIPVYNTAPYLQKCIDSIICQDFSDFEVLLVDDGSSDESGSICDEYAQRDDRIKVFHKENEGISSARNVGLDNAKGEWVYFVDSDDEILPGGLQLLVNSIKNGSDAVICGYELYNSEGNVIQSIDDRVSINLLKEDSLLLLFHGHTLFYPYMGYVWMWLFKNSIIQDNKLRFDISIKIKEDTLFVTQYLCVSNGRTHFNTAPVYKYKMRENSAMSVLTKGYDPAYLTSMDAVIKMHSCIMHLPNIRKDLSNAAKYEVIDRVYSTYWLMKKNDTVDDSIVSSLKKRAIKEVGLKYFLKYQFYRIRKKIKEYKKG